LPLCLIAVAVSGNQGVALRRDYIGVRLSYDSSVNRDIFGTVMDGAHEILLPGDCIDILGGVRVGFVGTIT
jgi:hypothetical protein